MITQTNAAAKLFIGLDIHKKTWKFHFMTDLFDGHSKSFPASIPNIVSFVNKHYSDHEVSIAYEAGCCGYVPARAFEQQGWDTFVVNPADIPRPAKNKFTKTDKIDARNIADQLKSGNLKKLHIPDLEREALRSMTRQRTALVRDYRRIKTRIKAFLLYLHIEIDPKFETPKWSLAFLKWLTELSFDNSTNRLTLDNMIEQYQFIDSQIKKVSNEIRSFCRKHHKIDYNLIRSIPGIGALTAAYILAEVGDIRRFSSIKKFASFIGFIPGIHQSADKEINLGCNPRANRNIRNLLVEAAWIAVRHDPALQQYYRKHSGKNPKAIIFKVAHKLLNRVYAVVKTQIPYEIGILK